MPPTPVPNVLDVVPLACVPDVAPPLVEVPPACVVVLAFDCPPVADGVPAPASSILLMVAENDEQPANVKTAATMVVDLRVMTQRSLPVGGVEFGIGSVRGPARQENGPVALDWALIGRG